MARRRRFYARDRRGRFARTTGAGGQYKKKMSTKKKLAIAGAGAVAVGAAAYGGRELYRAGGRKGFEYGKAQGIYEARPRREKGRFSKRPKVDTSQNPFEGRNRPRGPMGLARPRPTIGRRVRATSVAINRMDQNFAEGRARTDGMHVRRRAQRNAQSARRRASAAARRYNDAQSRSQMVNEVRNAGQGLRRASRNAGDTVRLQGLYASERASRTARRTAANVAATAVIGSTRKQKISGVPARSAYSAVGSPFPRQKSGKPRANKRTPKAKRNQRNRKRK